jgi:23S rRNA (cytidine1920-2'-O)/16S rRNA (cytidine1409-2'-O)-methyltransferase
MEGLVLVDGVKVTKPGKNVTPLAKIELIPSYQVNRYVSRGGLKLEHALTTFQVSVLGRICLDIGASTGGFTDCLLQAGATLVYAIDVGYGQIDWSLRNDPRVVVIERTNFRYLEPEKIYKEEAAFANLAVADVSFISLQLLFPTFKKLLDTGGADLICLVKPQFEAGRGRVGRDGVVCDPVVHNEVLSLISNKANNSGFFPLALTHSPLKGRAGNIEYLLHLSYKAKPDGGFKESQIEDIVRSAHNYFSQQKKG